MQKNIGVMEYQAGMQRIDESLMWRVLEERESYEYAKFSPDDVRRALDEENLSISGLKALLSPAASAFLEDMAQCAQAKMHRYFGNSVQFFTPLYISNFCDSNCTYCGFSAHNKISRVRLKTDEAAVELANIAKSGLKDVLILTGESSKKSDLAYIGEVCRLASELFSNVGIEIYPLNADEYAFLHGCGVDYVVVFQETYSPSAYANYHLAGFKRSFAYRFAAQERALMGGMRSVGFAALLGLDDFRRDAIATALHAHFIQQRYPHAEIALSCPRLRPAINKADVATGGIDEKSLFQVICAYRLFLPYANITISTRETARFRNGIIAVAANKISGGVSVGVGTHSGKTQKGDEQFEIADARSVGEILRDMEGLNLQPVMNEHIYV